MDFSSIIMIVLVVLVALLAFLPYGQRIKYEEEVRKAVCGTHKVYHFTEDDTEMLAYFGALSVEVVNKCFGGTAIAQSAQEARHKYLEKRASLLDGESSPRAWHELHEAWKGVLTSYDRLARFVIDVHDHKESLEGRLLELDSDWRELLKDVGFAEDGQSKQVDIVNDDLKKFADQLAEYGKTEGVGREIETIEACFDELSEKVRRAISMARSAYDRVLNAENDYKRLVIQKGVRNLSNHPKFKEGFDKQWSEYEQVLSSARDTAELHCFIDDAAHTASLDAMYAVHELKDLINSTKPSDR